MELSALFDEERARNQWFYVRPTLVTLSKALAEKDEKGKLRFSQADLYESWLVANSSIYPDQACLVRWMLIFAVNSSLIERGFGILKETVTDKRSSLKHKQIERLMLLAMNMPKKPVARRKFVDEIVEKLSE